MSANIRLRAALCLALSLGNAMRARADDEHLYRWVDRDGQLHITATPPPADAVPAASASGALGPVQVVPIESPAPAPTADAAPSPTPTAAPTRPPAPPPAASDGSDPCQPFRDQVARWLVAKQEEAAAEAEVERIDASPILGSRTGCSDAALQAHRCTETWYSRDEELARANARQAAAQEKLARVEETARVSGVPMVCLVDPAE